MDSVYAEHTTHSTAAGETQLHRKLRNHTGI